VMAATHCDLEMGIREGRFREDLYYRLNVIKIQVPPLRDCKERILPLAEFFLRKYATDGASKTELPQNLKDVLMAHDWPGNIRELENVMRKLLVLADPDLVAEELRSKARKKDQRPALEAAIQTTEPLSLNGLSSGHPILEKVNEAKKQAETDAILAALNVTHWNRKQAAALLKIDYKALLYKMKKLNIEQRAFTLSSAEG
jgi:two-component system response regulator AtoC